MSTIRMVRDAEQHPAPHVADVHPDEVENYRAGGWTEPHPLDHDGDGRKGGSMPDHVHVPADYEVDGREPPSKSEPRVAPGRKRVKRESGNA